MIRLPDKRSIRTADPSVAGDPGLSRRGRLTADDFGVSGFGQALLSQLGGDLGDLVDELHAKNEKELARQQRLEDAKFTIETRSRVLNGLTVELDRLKREGDPHSPTFATDFRALAQQKVADAIASVPLGALGKPTVSEEALSGLKGSLVVPIERMFGDALRAHNQAVEARYLDDLKGAGNALVARVRRDPGELAGAFQEVDPLLASAEGIVKADTSHDIEADLVARLLEAQIRGYADQGNFEAARVQLNNESLDEFLPPGLREQLYGEVDREEERVVAVRRAETRALVQDHLTSIQVTGQGIPGFREQARATLEPAAFDAFLVREEIARDAHAFGQGIQSQTPGRIAEELEALRPEPGTEGFAARQALFDAARKTASQEHALRDRDPAAAAARQPEVRDALEAARSGEGTLEDAISKGLAQQEAMEIPASRRVAVPNALRDQILLDIENTPVAERAAKWLGLQSEAGKHAPKLLSDLQAGGLSFSGQFLAFVAQNPVHAQTVAAAIEAGQENLKGLLEKEVVTEIEEGVRREMADFVHLVNFGDPSSSRAPMTLDMVRTLETVALKIAVDTGDPGRAVRDATDMVLDRYSVLDTERIKGVIPTQIDGQQVDIAALERAATHLLFRRSALEKLDLAPFGGDDETAREALLDALETSGILIPSDDGSRLLYAVRVEGLDGPPQILLNADGDPLGLPVLEPPTVTLGASNRRNRRRNPN